MGKKNENVSRRNAMKAAAIVPLTAVAGTAANSAIKVGVIGTGGRGTRLAGHMSRDTDGEIVALCDVQDSSIERASSRLPQRERKIYKDYRKLLESDVDAVIIATPVFRHAEHFEAAVKAGKHIYIEKPAAGTIAECKRIMKAADSADTKLNIQFGFQRRYGTVYQRAKKLIDSGEVGKINNAHAHFVKHLGKQLYAPPMPRPTTELERIRYWQYWRDLFGGGLVETFVHSVDVLNWFLGGHPQSAQGTGGRSVMRVGDILDHVDVSFKWENGLSAGLKGSFIAPPRWREVKEVFYCEKGAVETAQEYWIHYRKFGLATNDFAKTTSPRNIAVDSVQSFINRIKENRPENVGVRGAESTLTAIMAQMAVDEKREVTWDEVIRSG